MLFNKIRHHLIFTIFWPVLFNILWRIILSSIFMACAVQQQGFIKNEVKLYFYWTVLFNLLDYAIQRRWPTLFNKLAFAVQSLRSQTQ